MRIGAKGSLIDNISQGGAVARIDLDSGKIDSCFYTKRSSKATEDIAARVGKSEASIQATMRLLNLPEEAKKIMVKEKLTEDELIWLNDYHFQVYKRISSHISERAKKWLLEATKPL